MFAQWEWQNPYPHGYNLNDVQFIDPLTGWAVGEFGSVIKTDSGGDIWEVTHFNPNELLHAVCFTNYNHGWAVGDSGYIIQTDDGGNYWNQQTSGTNFELLDVHFADENNGWAVGRGEWDDYYWWQKTIIIHTNDGGINWEVQLLDSTFLLEAIHFVNDTLGWAVGKVNWNDTLPVPDNYSYITHTTDGGITWEEQNVESLWGFSDVYFYDNNKGWAAGHLNIWHTEDGGNTWIGQVENDTHSFTSICFSNSEIGWAVGFNPNSNPGTPWLIYTSDGGDNWEANNYYIPYIPFNSVSFSDTINGWIVGDNGLIRYSSDGGNTWESQSGINTKGDLFELFFIDRNNGWAVGNYWGWPWNGALMHTVDGGVNWTFYNWTSLGGPDDIYFIDHDNGWVSGTGYESSFIKHTPDGGNIWIEQFRQDDHIINDIFFADEETGWAVGYDHAPPYGGSILYTDNGGIAWISQNAGTDMGMEEVYFIDQEEGWSVGWLGTILHTINGGDSWDMQNSGLTENIYHVYFLNDELGWASSQYHLLQTNDGGLNWDIILTDSNLFINSIEFIDELNWWYTSGNAVYYTIDGGTTWHEMNTVVYDRGFNSICFTDYDNGWICGDQGTILHINNGSTVNLMELTEEINPILIYPNPSDGLITIKSELLKNKGTNLIVYNINGQMVEQTMIKAFAQNVYELDCSGYPGGIYFVTIRSTTGVLTQKLIIY